MHWPTKSYVVSPKHRLLYCPIPKVACSSIKLWLFELEEGKSDSLQASPHKHTDRHRITAYGRSLARQALKEKDWFRFAFVRNPWARLASAFTNKFLRHGNAVALEFFQEYHHWHRRRCLCRALGSAFLGSRTRAAEQAEPKYSYWEGPGVWESAFTFRRFIEFIGR